MKLNLGCGNDKRSGWYNIDIRRSVRPDQVADVRNLAFLGDGTAEEIVARDVLEHVGRREVIRTLREWFRVLRPGGGLFVQLPNLDYLARRYLERRDAGQPSEATAEFVRWVYGDQDYPENTHRCGFDADSLHAALTQAGFIVTEMTTDGGANLLAHAVKHETGTPNPESSTLIRQP